MSTLTDQLAESIDEYRKIEIPDDVRLIAKSSILDWFGVTIAAADAPAVEALRDTLPTQDKDGVTLVGTSRRANPVIAARINGTAGHVLDFDDVISAFGHPTVPVLPAVLATAEARGQSGDDVLRAFVAGVETECRVSNAAGPEHYELGFHSTATNGVFGSAAASALLLGLETDQVRHVLGLASTSASGLKSAFGTWGKSLQVGHASGEGLIAAHLVAAGGDGPPSAIEGPQGYLATHAPVPDAPAGNTAAGEVWETREMLFKYHASCYGTHSSIEALIGLRSVANGADIDRIDLGICPKHVGMCDQTDPRTPLEAKFSLAFTSAMAWADGRASAADFTDTKVRDSALQTLASRVTVTPSDERDFSKTAVTVRLTDGRVLTDSVDTSIAVAGDALETQWEKLVEKFHSLTDSRIGAQQANRVVDLVRDLENLDTIDELVAVLATV